MFSSIHFDWQIIKSIFLTGKEQRLAPLLIQMKNWMIPSLKTVSNQHINWIWNNLIFG